MSLLTFQDKKTHMHCLFSVPSLNSTLWHRSLVKEKTALDTLISFNGVTRAFIVIRDQDCVQYRSSQPTQCYVHVCLQNQQCASCYQYICSSQDSFRFNSYKSTQPYEAATILISTLASTLNVETTITQLIERFVILMYDRTNISEKVNDIQTFFLATLLIFLLNTSFCP